MSYKACFFTWGDSESVDSKQKFTVDPEYTRSRLSTLPDEILHFSIAFPGDLFARRQGVQQAVHETDSKMLNSVENYGLMRCKGFLILG